MAEVFAGFLVGYAIALMVGPLAAIAVVRSNDRTGVAQRLAPPGTSVIALSVVLHFVAMLMFTAIGLLFGMVLLGINGRRPNGGLGSPNITYTLLIVALTAALVAPTLAVPAIRRYALAGGIVFVVLFGWAMPWLASLG